MLGLIFISPFVLLLVLFALSNAGPVSLALWPTDLSVVVPLSIAVLVISAVFFVLGAIVVGLGSVSGRGRARRAERRVRALQTEIEALRARPPGQAIRTIDG